MATYTEGDVVENSKGELVQLTFDANDKALWVPYSEPDTEDLRLAAQGLTLGAADEAEAFVRNPLSGVLNLFGDEAAGAPYRQTHSEINKQLQQAKENYPVRSLLTETGGAVVPAIASTLLGGATAGPVVATQGSNLARLGRYLMDAGKSGIGAGVYSFNTGEGDFSDRLENVPTDAAAGFATAAALNKPLDLISRGLSNFARWGQEKLGRASRAVEQEVQKIAANAGMSFEEIVERVSRGEIFPDMSDTVRSVLRSYRASTEGGQTAIDATLRRRSADSSSEAFDTLQRNLAPETTSSSNLLKIYNQKTETNKDAASKEYKKIWGSNPDPVDGEITGGVLQMLARDTEMAKEAARLVKAETKKSSFFKVDKEGTIELLRNPTLQELEQVRRAFQDSANAAFQKNRGQLGDTLKSIEDELRKTIDDFSPALKATRQKWYLLNEGKRAHDAGSKAIDKAPDEIEILFEKFSEKGEEVIEAFRMGFASAIKKKRGTRQAGGYIADLADTDRNRSKVLEIIFPEDALQETIDKVTRAAAQRKTANTVIGGSQSAETILKAGRLGDNPIRANEAAGALFGNPVDIANVTRKFVGEWRKDLSQGEADQVVKILLSEDPQFLRKALTDENGLVALQRNVDRLVSILQGARTQAASVAGPAALDRAGLLEDNQ